MIERSQLCYELTHFLETDSFVDHCYNGLQLEGKPHIKSVAFAVSASLAAIQKAVELKVDALIVHHGLFWNKDAPYLIGTKKDKVALLLENQISLLAYHLPLDAHREVGNNWKAAKEMGWKQLKPFGLYKGMWIGVQGSFSKKPVDLFQKELETYYGHPAHTALGGKESVKTAALVSGGAFGELFSAKAAGVDCFITGNFDEPVWHQAFEEKMHFFALGHAATEKVGPKALCQYVQKRFKIPCHFIDCHNPF